MKTTLIIFLSLLYNFTFSQETYVKVYNPNAYNRPMLKQLDSTMERGRFIIEDTAQFKRITSLLKQFVDKYYTDESDIKDAQGKYKKGRHNLVSAVNYSSVCQIIYTDPGYEKKLVTSNRFRSKLKDFGEIYLHENWVKSKKKPVYELYLFKDGKASKFNLSTGNCIDGPKPTWYYFMSANGLIKMEEAMREYLKE